MQRKTFSALWLLSPTALAAQGNEIVLWNALRVGMSKADVKAVAPSLPKTVFHGCDIYVLTKYKHDRLTTVILLRRGKVPGCPPLMINELTRQYGEPRIANASQSSMPIAVGAIAFSSSSTKRVDRTWDTEGVHIVMNTYPSDENAFQVTYSVPTP